MQQNAGPDRAMLVAVKLANGKGRSIRSCEDADPGTPRTFPWGPHGWGFNPLYTRIFLSRDNEDGVLCTRSASGLHSDEKGH